MAKILKNYTPKNRPGPKAIYPYDEWLDGRTRSLKRGDDFQCTVESLDGLIRDAARKRNMTVHVWKESDTVIVVQARLVYKELKS